MLHFEKNATGEWKFQSSSPYGGRLDPKDSAGFFTQLQRMVDALPRQGEHCLALAHPDWRALAICLKPLVNWHGAIGRVIDYPGHAPESTQRAAVSWWFCTGVQFLSEFSGRYRVVEIESVDDEVDPDTLAPGDGQVRRYLAVIKQ